MNLTCGSCSGGGGCTKKKQINKNEIGDDFDQLLTRSDIISALFSFHFKQNLI